MEHFSTPTRGTRAGPTAGSRDIILSKTRPRRYGSDMHSVSDVFPLSGVPTITFVEPVQYSRLKVALGARGRGIIIEGPSGIGKTTAVRRAIDELGITTQILQLSARKAADLELIEALPEIPDAGIVIIDDFHRLNATISAKIADYMKVLADESVEETKLVILGINKAGDSLISFGRDVAARVDTIRFQREPEEHLEKLVNLGEKALNIKIEAIDDIVKAANGSFNLVQFLCQDACIVAEATSTIDGKTRSLDVSFELINGRIMDRFDADFGRFVLSFIKGGKLRREGRAPYLHLLKWLSEANEWAIDVDSVIADNPGLRGSVSQVVKKGYLEDLIDDPRKNLSDFLHYEPSTRFLSVEDPKFYYYIKNLAWNKLAAKAGYLDISFKQTVDFALSFAGEQRDVADALYEKLAEMELEVFYDKNEQSRILAQNVEEYLEPIYRSEATFVICLLSSEYPRKIWTKFEGNAFHSRFGSNDVIPVWFKDAGYGPFDQSREVGGFTYDPAGDLNSQVEELADILSKKIATHRREVNKAKGLAPDVAPKEDR